MCPLLKNKSSGPSFSGEFSAQKNPAYGRVQVPTSIIPYQAAKIAKCVSH